MIFDGRLPLIKQEQNNHFYFSSCNQTKDRKPSTKLEIVKKEQILGFLWFPKKKSWEQNQIF